MSAESKSLFNYENRTEKIIPADATMDISRGWKSEKSGLGFLAVWAWVWDRSEIPQNNFERFFKP